ncbi:purine nucleoside phosphorylase [Methylopila jiangsuensis]|uniref:Purine nucleoside phosphorylase n=1 Tax=Methylopila jiangsuensis TaxID=586230 RepID=A0A9W6N4J7_9HYPH|nr:purine-nucleoside phosphorylase [Methylopila jiangsuensis]MDR6285212.1 purine-nucleoside phosphorylase [Methylopila jiangsuensis]GLK77398.1 purine nucleoside phosphorylase [Methylopila jiangsuensis]
MTEAAARLRALGGDEPATVGLVLGTGLGPVTDAFEDAVAIPYADLPGFPSGGVSGHARRVVVGRFGGRRVAALDGRAHVYESGDPAAMRAPLETLKAIGVETLILTAAVGALDPGLAPGSLVAVADHINLAGYNPLIGVAGDGRFVDMVDAYSPRLRAALARAAAVEGLDLPEGVLMWFPGPSFETPAEIRAARVLGADLVGMSLAPEAVLARWLGFELAAVATVVNLAAGLAPAGPSHAESRTVAGQAADRLARLLARAIERL